MRRYLIPVSFNRDRLEILLPIFFGSIKMTMIKKRERKKNSIDQKGWNREYIAEGRTVKRRQDKRQDARNVWYMWQGKVEANENGWYELSMSLFIALSYIPNRIKTVVFFQPSCIMYRPFADFSLIAISRFTLPPRAIPSQSLMK